MIFLAKLSNRMKNQSRLQTRTSSLSLLISPLPQKHHQPSYKKHQYLAINTPEREGGNARVEEEYRKNTHATTTMNLEELTLQKVVFSSLATLRSSPRLYSQHKAHDTRNDKNKNNLS